MVAVEYLYGQCRNVKQALAVAVVPVVIFATFGLVFC